MCEAHAERMGITRRAHQIGRADVGRVGRTALQERHRLAVPDRPPRAAIVRREAQIQQPLRLLNRCNPMYQLSFVEVNMFWLLIYCAWNIEDALLP